MKFGLEGRSVLVMAGRLLDDVLYAAVDPRVRYS